MVNRVLEMLNALSTTVIAVTAVVSVFVARKLWKVSQNAADAAKVSAEAAKESVEIAKTRFEALQRPWVAISGIRRAAPSDDPVWRIEVDLKNHGTMAAGDVRVSIELTQATNNLLAEPGFLIGEIPPQAVVSHSIKGEVTNRLVIGETAEITVKVEVTYKGAKLAPITHLEYFRCDDAGKNFELRFSKTEGPKA
jgi:hypothetical protein